MRSLFCKLFLSFAFIALLASFTTAMISYLAQIGPYAELMKRVEHHQYQNLVNFLSVSGLAAVKILENGGEEDVLSYLQEVEKTDDSRILLFKKDNTTFSGRKLSPGGDDLVAAARESHDIQHNMSDEEVMVALPLLGADGKVMIIVGTTARVFWPPAFYHKKGGRKWPGPMPLGLPLLVMLLIAATGCLLLARSLTKPIRDLRRVAQKITKGDLSARVDLLSRRGDEIADLSHDFNIMVERTESLLQSQKRLLRDISHELRSPLTRLNLALELARQRSDNTESYLARIEKESDRMNELIDQLLMLTRLEGEVNSVPKEAVHLQRLVSDIVHDAEFETAGRNRQIKIENLDDAIVLGTREMLGRALENVIRNGIRYTAPESSIEVSLIKGRKHVTIFVRDHGPGVPEEYLEQIFKPFFRVAESRDRDSGGTGIGLAIAKQAILMHGGTIQAKNAENGGLVVQVRLPLL
jgi:two-component system, OmpR family, sensor histidine kinase CpxA